MYRIRTAAGSEATYNSLEEFTAAVRRGAVVPEDEIFHSRANRWLDVKSHPHYRTAIEGGHAPAPAAAAPAPAATAPAPVAHTQHRAAMAPAPSAPAPAPRPVQAPAPAHAPVQSRAQVFERPSAPVQKPVAQTQVHPQLQAAPRPEPVAPPAFTPPAKSKDLTFVDTGVAPTVGHPHAPVVELAPPPAPPRTELKPAAKPAPIAKSTGSEMDFLIMDGGIESPVRTSAGHKTIPEEFGLLFDATAVEPQAPAAPTTGKNGAIGARSGKQQAIVVPEAPAAAPAMTPIAHSTAEAAHHETPAAAPAPAAPQASSWATGSRSNYLGGGIALVVIAVGLLAWKPWKGGDENPAGVTPVSAQAPAPSYDPDPSSLVTAVSATTPPIGSMTGAAAAVPTATKPGAAPAGKPTDTAVAPVDSAKPEVVVAARPEFGGGLPVSGDISIGTEVATRGTTSSIAPSELVHRMQAAQKDAQLDLNGRLVTIGFRGVINPARLSTPALVAAARTAWTGGVEAIRNYRARIARVEKAYEDSVLTSQRAQRWPADEMRAWTTRQSLSEPSDASQLSDLMFTQVGEALEILASMPGEYSVTGDKISFKDAGSATRYTSIRGWVEQRMATWSSTPESARPYSVSATLRALGDGFPAVQ